MFDFLKKIIITFLGLVILGYLALVIVYLLPTSAIQKNVAEAANIIQMEKSHPELVYGHQDTMLDNLTDSIMMGTARYETKENVFLEALLSNRETSNLMMDSEVIAAEASNVEFDSTVSSYGRYWHGYLLYLKPLLLLLNYGQIRYFIAFFQMTLFVAVLYLMVKKNKEHHIIPFIVAYLFLNPAALSLSLQYFPVSVITMIQFILLLAYEESYKNNNKKWFYHFFIVGCLVAYFDFLTFPLLSLGMPLCFLIAENRKTLKENMISFVGSCMAWGFGYAAMWGSKWVLGSLITKENIIADAVGNVLLRVGATESESKVSALEVILKNIGANKLCLLITVVIAVGIFVCGILKKRRIDLKNVNIVMILCAILPLMWYLVVSNHSYIHYWFTHRILAISIYAMLLVVMFLFVKDKN